MWPVIDGFETPTVFRKKKYDQMIGAVFRLEISKNNAGTSQRCFYLYLLVANPTVKTLLVIAVHAHPIMVGRQPLTDVTEKLSIQ